MPGFYPEDEYDLAGFAVGIVDKEKIIDGKDVKNGDVLIGVSSSGVHSNGFSLVRKVFNVNSETVADYYDELGKTLGEELLTPTKIYVKSMLSLFEQTKIKAISHITGGGFYENIPRMLPDNCDAVISKSSFPVLPIFKLIQSKGQISERDMFNTFNMGIGLIFAIDSSDAEKAVNILNKIGEKAYIIGSIEKGEKGVRITE